MGLDPRGCSPLRHRSTPGTQVASVCLWTAEAARRYGYLLIQESRDRYASGPVGRTPSPGPRYGYPRAYHPCVAWGDGGASRRHPGYRDIPALWRRRGARSDRGLRCITATRSITAPTLQGHRMRGLCRVIMSHCVSPTRPPRTGCGSASWRTAARSRRWSTTGWCGRSL
jgi:hypothetical protein